MILMSKEELDEFIKNVDGFYNKVSMGHTIINSTEEEVFIPL